MTTADNYRKGMLLTTLGVLVICPDTLLLRLINVDQWTLLFWRGLLSGAVILVGVLMVAPAKFAHEVKSVGGTGIVFALMFSLGTVLFIVSISHTSVANSLFIVSTSPLFAAIMARGFLREQVSRQTWVTIAVALAGIGLIASGSIDTEVNSLYGDLAALGTAITMAATFTLARSRREVSMVPAMGVSGLLTAAIALSVALPQPIPASSLLPLIVMGCVIVPLAFVLLTLGPRYIPAPQVSLLLLAEAVIGPLLVWYFAAEYPGNRSIAGGIIVLLALAIPNLHQLVAGSRGIAKS